MTALGTPADGPMNNPQPRRYAVRKLHDVDGLTQAEIAEKLHVSQATVQRDLSQTVPPSGKTPGGSPVYPLGRFNEDPDYVARVSELARDMPDKVARLQAAREFAGSRVSPPVLGQVGRIRTEIERRRLLRAFDRGEDGEAA